MLLSDNHSVFSYQRGGAWVAGGIHNFLFLLSDYNGVESGKDEFAITYLLDDRKSLSIAFLAISDQYATFFFYFVSKMAAGGHFGYPICAKTIGFFHYVLSMAMPNMKFIGELMTKLETPQAF